MPGISVADPSIKNTKKLSELSIQVSPNGFSFCVLSEDAQLMAFRNYPFDNVILFDDLVSRIEQVLQEDKILKIPAATTRIIYTGRNSTIIPDDFASDESLKKILDFNHPVDEDDEIHLNKLGNSGLNLVFTVHHYITNQFNRITQNAVYFNQATPLLHHVLSREERGNEVFIQVSKEFFDIIIVVGGRLKLCNSFPFANATDLIYFILYACKQLRVDTKRTHFHLVGDFPLRITLYKELSSYLPLTSKLHRDEIVKNTRFSGKVDTSQFFSLLNLHTCVL